MKFKLMHWIILVVSFVLAGIAFILFSGDLLNFLLVILVIFAATPFIVTFLLEQNKLHEKEGKFLEFSRDLVEMSKSGTPVNKSIMNLRNRNYGALSLHVMKLANQLSLGINFDKALGTFAKEIGSPVISRAVSLISEAERAGGKIEEVLESVSSSVNQVEQLKKERKAAVSNLVTQGYMIFFMFIIIMLALEFKILPLVSELQTGEGLNVSVKKLDSSDFSMPLFAVLLVQSFFAGFVIGKISEGTLRAGVKHSFILLAITLLVTTGARAFF